MLSNLPRDISTHGAQIDAVMRLIFWICGAWFVVAEAVLVYLLVRYRRRKGVRAAWLPATDRKTLAWVLVPAVLVLAFDLLIEHASAAAWARTRLNIPAGDVVVRITGRQYFWAYRYAGHDRRLGTADDFDGDTTLRVPRGRIIRFQLEAADVIHALWMPSLRLKLDAIPGRSIPGWFEATREGTYPLVCAELCGAAHGYMRSSLTVMSPEAFDEWSRSRAPRHEDRP